MKTFLHIGTEKTGTTTLQKFLFVNRLLLGSNGFIYPESAGETNHRALSVAAYRLDRRCDSTMQYGIRTDNDLRIHQKLTIERLRREVANLSRANADSSLLISSEHFHSRLTDHSELERLRDIIHWIGGSDIHVIVYLRRPAEIANSLVSTALRCGRFIDSPPRPGNTYLDNLCNHEATLKRFAAVFGQDHLVPRLYSPGDLKNRSIIDDFLDLLGSSPDCYVIPESTNQALSASGTALLRVLNRHIPFWIDGKPNKLRADLIDYIQSLSGPKYQMPAALIEQYDSYYHQFNEWTRRNYFPERDNLFSSELPDTYPSLTTEPTFEEIAELIGRIWNQKQSEIIALSNLKGKTCLSVPSSLGSLIKKCGKRFQRLMNSWIKDQKKGFV